MSKTDYLKSYVFCFSLIILFPPLSPIHFINPDDMKWIYWIEPTGKFSFQYPDSTEWKTSIGNNSINKEIYYFQLSHSDDYGNVHISMKIIPFDIINRYKVLDFNFALPSKDSLNPEILVDLFENYANNNLPNFSVFEKHSDKYTLNGNIAYGILTRHSFGLGNTTGMLTLYSVDNKNNNIIEFKYIFDPNSFIAYLPIAEKILNSIRINN